MICYFTDPYSDNVEFMIGSTVVGNTRTSRAWVLCPRGTKYAAKYGPAF